jgi:cardiolipin synthase
MAKLVFNDGNQVQLLHTGEQFFAALIDAIHEAQHDVFLETYIYATDQSAQTITLALCQAAQRGVCVQVIIDWLGGGNHTQQLQTDFQQAGVQCRLFNPWFKRGLARTHRKLAVIDQATAFIGGINIIDDCVSDDGRNTPLPYPRWDFAVQVNGNLVQSIHKEISTQWLKMGKLQLLQRLKLTVDLRTQVKTSGHHLSQAALVIRDNLRNRTTIQKAYLKALGSARQTAILANPYFAPGRRMRNGLIRAAQRGVDVSLLLGVGEFDWQDAVTQSYYPKLLASGVKIFEYRKTNLHAKVAVIDDNWATVGSSNFDGLSLFVNHEANIVVLDQDFASQLKQHLVQGLQDAIQVDPHCVVKQSWIKRFKHRLAYWFYRSLMRLATLGEYR